MEDRTRNQPTTPDQNGHPDVMRRAYRELTGQEQRWVEEIKTKGDEFYKFLQHVGGQRAVTSFGGDELTIAKTRIQEAVMWGVKAITG